MSDNKNLRDDLYDMFNHAKDEVKKQLKELEKRLEN